MKNATIHCLADNGLAVLETDTKEIVLVDLNTGAVRYSQYKIDSCDQIFSNEATGELWIWNWNSKKLSIITQKGLTPLGTLKGHRQDVSLLHVTKKGQLLIRNRLGVTQGQIE